MFDDSRVASRHASEGAQAIERAPGERDTNHDILGRQAAIFKQEVRILQNPRPCAWIKSAGGEEPCQCSSSSASAAGKCSNFADPPVS